PLPASTPVPYTTLFRSRRRNRRKGPGGGARGRGLAADGRCRLHLPRERPRYGARDPGVPADRPGGGCARQRCLHRRALEPEIPSAYTYVTIYADEPFEVIAQHMIRIKRDIAKYSSRCVLRHQSCC